MKLQIKASLLISLFGLLVLAVITLIYERHSQSIAKIQEQENMLGLAKEVASHLDSRLKQEVDLALTLASMREIALAAGQSSALYTAMGDQARSQTIEAQERQWQAYKLSSDPFIRRYLQNPTANLLTDQQKLLQGHYGEIFLTNRYGALIASTGRLTTLAHAHKYWWKSAFDKGEGKVFIDDRGFDDSVAGYVLGIVVPVRYQGEVVGILKCNINLDSALSAIISDFRRYAPREIAIVRSRGRVVISEGVEPLTTKVADPVIRMLQVAGPSAAMNAIDDRQTLYAQAPVAATVSNESFGFGGKPQTIDHQRGNEGESWHVLISFDEAALDSWIHGTTKDLIAIGLLLTIFTTLIGFLLGHLAARPIQMLTLAARRIGSGLLDTKIDVNRGDEIGELARELGDMAANLKATMASKDDLEKEISRRIELEEKLKHQSITDELTGLYNRRAINQFSEKAVSAAHRHASPLSLMMFDLDDFKLVNDRHGHLEGDRVLKSLVAIVAQVVREEDFVARWGGEEFVILMPNTRLASALVMAERLREKVASGCLVADAEPAVTLSVGICQLADGEDVNTLFQRLDAALYRAKNSGKNCVVEG